VSTANWCKTTACERQTPGREVRYKSARCDRNHMHMYKYVMHGSCIDNVPGAMHLRRTHNGSLGVACVWQAFRCSCS
jgi:hypothetical protein